MTGAVRAAVIICGLFGIAIVVQLILAALFARDMPTQLIDRPTNVHAASPVATAQRRPALGTPAPATATTTPTRTSTRPPTLASPTIPLATPPTAKPAVVPTAMPTITASPTAVPTAVPPTAIPPTAPPEPTQEPQAAPAPTAPPAPPDRRTHTVRVGDTVTSIAARFGVSPQSLITANKLTGPQWLRIGQVLVIP